MATFDRKIYGESTIDWEGLRQLAKRAAEETFEYHANDYWVLQTRTYFYEEIYNNGTRINEEYHDKIEYCLGVDGRLFVHTTSDHDRFFNNMAPIMISEKSDNPMSNTDVINFDFEPQYREDRGERWFVRTNRDPGDKLLYQTKGEGLRVQLIKLLDKSFKKFIVNADKGDENAQYYAGECYYLGKGVKQNYEQAIEWYIKAANQGNAAAQFRLGEIYFNGSGVSQDYEQAIEWYTKAAYQGNAVAQNILGDCYFHGKYFDQNYKKAFDWYAKAADRGNADAQCALGECYQHGYGIIQDNGKAIEWYSKAANQGNILAQNELKKIQEQKEKERELEQKQKEKELKLENEKKARELNEKKEQEQKEIKRYKETDALIRNSGCLLMFTPLLVAFFGLYKLFILSIILLIVGLFIWAEYSD